MAESERIEAALERLENLLSEKEDEADELRGKLAVYEEGEAWSWTRHRVVSADPSPKLPVPRLEIRYSALDGDPDGYNGRALYCLVYRHYTHGTGGLKCDDSKDCIVFVPIGETRCGGGARPLEPREAQGSGGLFAGRSYGPHRDGAHIRHEMRELKLPGFIIGASGDTYQVDLEAEAKAREEWERRGGR
jgi:hypothetical protein